MAPKAGVELGTGELSEFAEQRIARYKLPRRVKKRFRTFENPLGRSARRGRQPGWMFLLWWKALSGSYLALTSASRR